MSTIVDHIGVPALLEQTAEECCELAQACLKMARKLRDENPTPKSIEDIRDCVIEESADVQLCLELLETETRVLDFLKVGKAKQEKAERWCKRLGLSIDLEEDDGN